ncbi:T9SS type B sorting domain-containing protein [uncultured Psychroserpens sp.]|uniref:T9SS type B sorting domain-containing protein n=1 Tax=uncultured Psychroserpens sp. TaxID=255436 RepID=UPI002635C4AB|nr:T9SS type B sorting domain-containing protein [uncultured Psychroserpens sp.]
MELLFKKVVPLIFVLFSSLVCSQNEANIWYFGKYAGLDFNNGSPVILSNSQMNAREGSAVMSDFEGNLLFYTDGITVWNRAHDIMFNGEGLKGGLSSFQSAIIVPNPQDTNIYYIFTIDHETEPNGLQYSEVNMTLDDGLGGVTSAKNIFLHSPTPEMITATKSSTSNEYWIVSHKWDANEFISYNVSAAGVNHTAVISPGGANIGANDHSNAFQGSMKISPDGTKLAIGSVHLALQLFDFDASTGAVSNPITLDSDDIYSGVEFSPNSKVLYSVANSFIYQYNLQAQPTSGIISSKFQLNTDQFMYFGAQLAPDGKIYIANRDSPYLSVIEYPNNLGGIGANFISDHLYLNGAICKEGLPNFVPTFFLDRIRFDPACFGSSTQFSLTNNRAFDTIIWNFDDPASGANNISTDVTPSHVFSAPGTYEVSVNLINGTQTLSLYQTVIIYDTPVAHHAEDLYVCYGQDIDLSIQNTSILNGQSPTATTLTYHLSQIEADNNTNPIGTSFVNTSNPQIIYARLELTGFPYCYDTTSFQVNEVGDFSSLSMADTWYLCEDGSVEIIADDGYDSYLWSTGEISSSIIVDAPGNYTVTVSNNYGDVICNTMKTVTVIASNEATITEIETIDLTNGTNAIIVNVEGNGDYEYSINGFVFQDSNTFTNLSAYDYTVYVRDKRGCGIVSESVYLLGYQKYFTPNGDGYHDTWQIINGFREPINKIFIFNRYGKLLKELSATDIGWDGTFNGTKMLSSDYWFVLERQNGKRYSGHFTLKR